MKGEEVMELMVKIALNEEDKKLLSKTLNCESEDDLITSLTCDRQHKIDPLGRQK